MDFRELLGVVLVVLVILGIASYVSSGRLPRRLKRLIYWALALRVVGATVRYEILFRFYGGVGDAGRYYNQGLRFADYFRSLDLSPLYDSSMWFAGRWTGTTFVYFPSAIVLSLIGPSLRGEFIAFSLLAFLGLAGFAIAFKRSCPHVPLTNYVRWIWFFPSLWFWPSSVGKEALVLMGFGLAMWGFFGPKGRRNWPLFAVGVLIITAVRAQVAVLFLASVVLAQWLSLGGRWTFRRFAKVGASVGLGMAGIVFAMNLLGVDILDPSGIQGYIQEETSYAVTYGSAVEEVGFSLTSVPVALLNIVARPFPWEATNVMAFASALEVLLFWSIVWYRRRNVWAGLRAWRKHPLLRIAVPFSLLYTAMLGMVVFNLGIIARQRIFVFPFLFVLLEAVPASSGKERPYRRPRSVRQPRKRPPTMTLTPGQ